MKLFSAVLSFLLFNFSLANQCGDELMAYKIGDVFVISFDNPEDVLPEIPKNLKWEYQYSDEPPLGGHNYKVVSANETIKPEPTEDIYKIGDRFTVPFDRSKILPELPSGLSWKYLYTDEPPVGGNVYEVIHRN